MKSLLLAAFLLLCFSAAYSQVPTSNVKDGLYLIASIDSTAGQQAIPAKGAVVKFSKLFDEFKSMSLARVVVDTNEYVPLELGKSPTATPQTKTKKKLLLTLTPTASEKLRSFTEKYLSRKVAVVVDGEVVSLANVSEAINNGQLQIAMCTANACERLYFKLEENVKRK